MISRDRREVKRGVVQISMIGDTIAFGYNKPGCELELTLDRGQGGNVCGQGLVRLGVSPRPHLLGTSIRWLWKY